MGASSGPNSIELAAKVLRKCRCGTPNPRALSRCSNCGHASRIEDLGLIAQRHANPFVHFFRDLKIKWRTFIRLYREL